MKFQDNLKQSFLSKLIDVIKFYFFLRTVRRRKKRALWEAKMDRHFFQIKKKDALEYDETADRRFLQDERSKPEGKRDELKIIEAEDRIAGAKAIKKEWRNNEEFIRQMESYIDALNQLIKK